VKPEDYDFEREFEDRFWAVLLKKNLYLNGFMGPMGMMWTQQAYEEQHNVQEQSEK
jgi:hypothetical protein